MCLTTPRTGKTKRNNGSNPYPSRSYYNEARDHERGRMTGVERFDWRDCVGQYRLYYLVRSMHALAMLMCAMNVVARIVAAAFIFERAGLSDEAAAAFNTEGMDTRSNSDREEWQVKDSTAQEKTAGSFSAFRVLEAAILALMTGAFLLFFPACIVMFRRVERRLDGIMQEMNHRSDLGTVFLPYEFSPAGGAADGARSQVEMQVVEARAFLGQLKSAAAAQGMRFFLCLLLVLLALLVRSFFAVFIAIFYTNSKINTDCGKCGSCQSIERFMLEWYDNTPELFPLVASTCSTLPLMFSLWLMTTKEDRALMLNPGRFRTDAIALHPVQDEATARLGAERVRMGIELR